MKDYYALLRISRAASETEIKIAFRRLAILLHPDKNPHPEAPQAFQELNEAYEILGDPIKRALYDQMLGNTGETVSIVATHRDPAYRKKQAAGYKPSKPEPSAGHVAMWKLMPITRYVAAIGLLVSTLLWLDYFLPNKISDEIIVDWHRRNEFILDTNKGNSFHLLYPKNLKFMREPRIKVHTSYLFSFARKIETQSGSYAITSLPSIYRNFLFGPIILLGLSLVSFMTPFGETKFTFSVATFFLLMLNVVFVFTSYWTR